MNIWFLCVLYLFAEFKELWNSTTVDSLDEEKIQEYLKKQGINSMQDHGPKKFVSIDIFTF